MRIRVAASLRAVCLLTVFGPMVSLFLAGCDGGDKKPVEVAPTQQAIDANKNMDDFMKNQGKGAPKK